MLRNSLTARGCSCSNPRAASRLTSPWCTPFQQRVIERSTFHQFLPEALLNTCSAEDLITLKAFADRSRDWADIESIVLRMGARLDWAMVEAELQPLCEVKEAPDILARLSALRVSHGDGPAS